MKQVALEVLSYHVSSSQEEVDRLAVIIQAISVFNNKQFNCAKLLRANRYRVRTIWACICLHSMKIAWTTRELSKPAFQCFPIWD